MKRSEFLAVQREYYETVRRFSGIHLGDLVWEPVTRGGGPEDTDYHPAVVRRVNVHEAYVDVIDVSSDNERRRYADFLTESEMTDGEFPIATREGIEEDYRKYMDIINSIKGGKK